MTISHPFTQLIWSYQALAPLRNCTSSFPFHYLPTYASDTGIHNHKIANISNISAQSSATLVYHTPMQVQIHNHYTNAYLCTENVFTVYTRV